MSKEEYIYQFSIACKDYKEHEKERFEYCMRLSIQRQEEHYNRNFATLCFADNVVNFMKNLRARKKILERKVDQFNREHIALRDAYQLKKSKVYLIDQQLHNSDKGIVDDGDKHHGYSERQIQRVERQVLSCAHITNILHQRYSRELSLLNNMQHMLNNNKMHCLSLVICNI